MWMGCVALLYDSGGHGYSCDALHSGLYYTSAYYEEEQLYSENRENIQSTYGTCNNHKNNVNAPVKIEEHSATIIDLPPIEWHGYKTAPKILSITNTGRTILINGQWLKGRPYIGGGPLNGNYMFSQIHFHSPSEHEIAGKRYPLEMHVVHYKTSYLTQERAMRERDGTVVVVYLFQVSDADQTALSSFVKLAPEIEKANSRTETTNVSLDEIVKPFSSNYYIYWGSVTTEKNSYLLQWIISGGVLYVNQQEAEQLLNIMNFGGLNAEAPRMKPEDDAIFYVEKIEETESEQKEEPKPSQCHICQVHQEWWLAHYSVADSKTCEDNKKDAECSTSFSLNFEYYPKVELSRSQHESVTCKVIKSFAGMRTRCCQKKKKQTNSCCCSRTVSLCSCKQLSQASASTEQNECKTSKKTTVKAQESSSCPSVSTDVEEQAGEEKTMALKVMCSCPSVNKTSDSQDCKKSKKNKKNSEVCVVIDSSSNQSTTACKNKESKEKTDCDSEKDDNSSQNSKKKVKKEKPKKEKSKKKCKRESEPSSEIESASSKSGTNVKEKKKKKEPKTNNECAVECMIGSLPDKSFEEILREYDTTWLVDSNLKMSKTDTKISVESLETNKSKESVRSKSPPIECRDTITTIYEKKRSSKPPVHVEDCTVSFLLTPNDRRSIPSSTALTAKSASEEMKAVQNPESITHSNDLDLSANTFTISGIKQPSEKSTESKELCVQVELSINSENKDFSECLSQEYNFALMYNQNILQEYKGVFRPDKIHLGNYEKLELVPKYPEPDGVCIRVQDCIIKMESLDKLSMRAKFLLKEINLNSLPNIRGLEGNPEKKIEMLCDAITQCSVRKFIKPNEAEKEVLKINNSNETSESVQRNETEEEPKSSLSILNTSKQDIESPKEVQSFEQIFLKDGLLEDKIKLVKDPVNDMGESSKELFNSSEQLIEPKDSKEVSDRHLDKKSTKELKQVFSKKKKTVYFIYEKIEKDENSGKRILIGSFRSKEEMESFSKEKKSSTEPVAESENNEGGKVLMLHPKDSKNSVEVEQEVKNHSPNDIGNVLPDEKDVITLHKFKPKGHLGVSNPKNERLKLVVGRVLNHLERDSKSFKRLADLVGMTKRGNSKISVYELQNPENESENSASGTVKETQNAAESKTQAHAPVSRITLKKASLPKMSGLDPTLEANQKLLTNRSSQGAVIVIPVEVESLSKVEVILVEHSDNPIKITAEKDEKEIIPCLNYPS